MTRHWAEAVVARVREALAGRAADVELQPEHPTEDGLAPAAVIVAPANREACAMTIWLDDEGQATISIGRYETRLELWVEPHELAHAVAEYALAAADGRYEEWVRLEEGRPRAAKGVFSMPDGEQVRVHDNVLFARPHARRGWEHVRYAPY